MSISIKDALSTLKFFFEFHKRKNSKVFLIKQTTEDIYHLKGLIESINATLTDSPSAIIELNSHIDPPMLIQFPSINIDPEHLLTCLQKLSEMDFDEKLYGIRNSIQTGVKLWNQSKDYSEESLKDIYESQQNTIPQYKLITLDENFKSFKKVSQKLSLLLTSALDYLISKHNIKIIMED